MYKKLNICIFIILIFLFFSKEIIANDGEVMWTESGVQICSASDRQYIRYTISDDTGGAFIAWEDKRNGDYDIYVQRVDATGNSLWTNNGMAVCTATGDQSTPELASDGNGGVIVTWDDQRTGNYDIYAQRLDASGNILWTENGIPICTATGNQSFTQWLTQIISDGNCGAIITWQDARSDTNHIYAQRIDSSGTVEWTTNGVAVCTASNNQYDPTLVTDGNEGSIITWWDGRGANYDIYAQKIDKDGTAEWTANGAAICSADNDQKRPKIALGAGSSAIITWDDYRGGTDAGIYVQRISTDGAVQWTTNGVFLGNASDVGGYPVIVSDIYGSAIIAWQTYNFDLNISDIYAQKVNSSGTVQWTTGGVVICAADGLQYYPQITTDGNSGAIITWTDSRSGADGIYAQKVDTNGDVQWTANGVPICIQTGGAALWPIITSDNRGGAIIAWQDSRNDDWDIYVQRIEGLHIWYFAEGCTNGFDYWLLLQNPNTSSADCRITFMKANGSTVIKNVTVPAASRYTLYVNNYSEIQNESFAAKIETTNGVNIVPERSMYWNADGVIWSGGHCGKAVTSPAATWSLAEGCTLGSFDEWILLENPNNIDSNVTISFIKNDGTVAYKDITVSAHSRYTLHVNDILGK